MIITIMIIIIIKNNSSSNNKIFDYKKVYNPVTLNKGFLLKSITNKQTNKQTITKQTEMKTKWAVITFPYWHYVNCQKVHSYVCVQTRMLNTKWGLI